MGTTALPVSIFFLLSFCCGGGYPPPNAPTGANEPQGSEDTPASTDDKGTKDTGSSSGGGGGAGKEPDGPVKVGDKAPTFSIDSMNGQGKAALSPGKVTVVDFW